MTGINCTSPQCLGGAIFILNSNGLIDSSYFSENYCESNGGAIGIVNLNGNITISQTSITNNTSSDGDGGGIYFLSNENTHILKIAESIIERNNAQGGGGIYIQTQLNPENLPYLV